MLLDSNYRIIKNLVIKAERRILNTLGFVVHVHHPHKLIYVYLNSLQLLDTKDLLQKAWSYMNDGLRTDIFLRYKPETIACACIHLAARTIEKPVVLPKNPSPWFELFDVSDRDVNIISLILMELYTRTEPPKLHKLSLHVEKLSNNFLKNGTEKDESHKQVVEAINCEKIRTFIEKFDQMQEKKPEKIKVIEEKRSDSRRKDENGYKEKEKRRNNRDRKKSRSKSPRKRLSRSRSPYKKHKHDKYDRKRR